MCVCVVWLVAVFVVVIVVDDVWVLAVVWWVASEIKADTHIRSVCVFRINMFLYVVRS